MGDYQAYAMDGADELRSNGLYIHRELSYATAIKEQPVTEQRKPYTPAYGDNLIDAGTARANIAASRESPNGTMEDDYAKTHQHQTVCHITKINETLTDPLSRHRSSYSTSNTGIRTAMASSGPKTPMSVAANGAGVSHSPP